MCDCKGWQISGVPCKHVLACILVNRLEVFNYIHESISKMMYLKTYSSFICLVADQALWSEVGYDDILPPQMKSKFGRPKISRRKGADEDPNPKAYTFQV